MSTIEKIEELIQSFKDGDKTAEIVIKVMLYQYVDIMDSLEDTRHPGQKGSYTRIKGGLVEDASDEIKEILGYE